MNYISIPYFYLMKIKFLRFCLCVFGFLLIAGYVRAESGAPGNDTNEVKKMNRLAFGTRLTNPDQTIKQANKALTLAKTLGYIEGMAEANRELGIGYYYLGKPDSAIQFYLNAKKIYDENNNLKGQARVLNNIGNLYRETDDDNSIKYFHEALDVAVKMKDEDLIGSIYLNIGNGYNNLKDYSQALEYYNKSGIIFDKLKNKTYAIQCLQDKGVIYSKLGQIDTALKLLLDANKQAKGNDLNITVASVDLSLTTIFTARNEFDKADYYYQEGLSYANQLKSTQLVYDYNVARYQILSKRKEYKGALDKLVEIYRADSTNYSNNTSARLKLLDAQYKQNEKDQENLHTIEQNKYNLRLFIASSIVACLLAVVIFLLMNNVNRKVKINKHLTELNEQISVQKENLNQINHHLEEIIDERTKDLQVKNKKLADDYSLHLSHQIRGPIATLKGLLNLERDRLIEKDECIKLMNKCVSDIDENIIDMSGMLHESSKGVVKPGKN